MTWDIKQLATLLAEQENWVVTQEQDCLLVANEDGLDAWLAISGEQILVETLLFATNEVTDAAGLNDHILRTHMIFPLTTIAINHIGDDDYYVAFGALSSQSKPETVVIEIQTLFQNVEGFLDAYKDYLQ